MSDRVRDLALEALRRVATQGAFASAVLRGALEAERSFDERDRALATELVYGVLRRRGQLDRAISALGKRLKDLDPKIHDVLRLAAYQLLFLDRVPDHAAVNAAVDQARRRSGAKGAGQANAILRKLAALPADARLPAPPPLERDPVAHIAERTSLPRPIVERLIEDLGPEATLAFGLASLERAPLTLRVNPLRTTREALVEDVGGTPGEHPLIVRLPDRGGTLPSDFAAVVEGRATPQDEASLRVVDLLDPQPGERVLDVCAAPGGKTTAIAERMGDRGEVVAGDRSSAKLELVAAAAKRLGLGSIRISEALPPIEPAFDRVLVDAPCSGLGTLRRHPEIRWRLKLEDFIRLATLQREVLREGAARVRPGGVLVYSVCTITREEGASRAGELYGFDRVAELRTGPEQPGSPDGFYAAKLIRRVP